MSFKIYGQHTQAVRKKCSGNIKVQAGV